MIKITAAAEPIRIESICVMVYGSPGLGKTTLGAMCESPIMLDFDRGAHRAAARCDSVQVDRWQDVAGMTAGDVAGYKTIVVDTVGRLLDTLAASIITDNPKMKGYGGALSLQGYGALKAAYAGWLKTVRSYGLDVVLLAHDKEDKQGDDLIVRPDIQGGSYAEIVKATDAIGYLHAVGRDRVIDFALSDRWIGKDPAQLGSVTVATVATSPAFFASVLCDIKGSLNRMSEAQAAALAEVDAWRLQIEDCVDAHEINAMIEPIKVLAEPLQSQARHLLAARAKALGLVADKKAGCYGEPKAA